MVQGISTSAPITAAIGCRPATGPGCGTGGNAATATSFDSTPVDAGASIAGAVAGASTVTVGGSADMGAALLGTGGADGAMAPPPVPTGVTDPGNTTSSMSGSGLGATSGLGTLTLGAGSQAGDEALLTAAFATLGTSAHGANIVTQLQGSGAKISLLSDSEFAARQKADAHAYYDPTSDTMFLRRTDLQTNQKLAALEIAHEGVHLLDDKGKVADGWTQQASAGVARLGNTQAAAEAMKQAEFEHRMIMEARAFTFSGQVARELGVQTAAADPTTTAAAGANDRATYDKVWLALLTGPYNPDNRSAQSKSF